MRPGVRINERSWNSDVVSEINAYLRHRDIEIDSAGDNLSIEGARMFPDITLFGKGGRPIQIWELKMPETPITADDPLLKAERKANMLGLNSFVVWNASRGALYLRDEDGKFAHAKGWNAPSIRDRDDVSEKREDWIECLHDILETVNRLAAGREIREIDRADAIREEMYAQIVRDASPGICAEIEKKIRGDRVFQSRLEEWWRCERAEHAQGSKMTHVLSRYVAVSWINRFVFANCLKGYYSAACKVEEIGEESSIESAILTFREISESCGFRPIFEMSPGDECIDDRSWKYFLELNRYLLPFRMREVSGEILKSMLAHAIDGSKRETAGQYCTPRELARLLVEVSVTDRNESVIDPCCGTGTIIREALAAKKETGVKDPQIQIWASDKFAYPLGLCSMSLIEPGSDSRIQAFVKDAFSLAVGDAVRLSDPKTGEATEVVLPRMGAIVSNLPFVRFENIGDSNQDKEHSRWDLSAIIAVKLSDLLKPNGRAGFIMSNSWLGTEWGKDFWSDLLCAYEVESVIVSQSGRWFKNADVVASILVLRKRTKPQSDDERIRFVAVAERIERWNRDATTSIVNAILLNNNDSESACIHEYSLGDIARYRNHGVGMPGLFTDLSWMDPLFEHLVPVSTFFDINRGERRGWDPLFFPDGAHGIEEEYLRPVLKTSKGKTRLEVEPDGVAFCCAEGEEELEKGGKPGALRWIWKFKDEVNEKGKPLASVLERHDMRWYEMSPATQADLAMSVNPNDVLLVHRLKNRSFVNQRLIRLTAKDEAVDIGLCHALLNSSLGLFMIESQGFGRGLGVLDLRPSGMKKGYFMLDPRSISPEGRSKIMAEYASLLSRDARDVRGEMSMPDRVRLDDAVLKAFGASDISNRIRDSLLEVFSIRKAVESDKRVLKP